MRYLLCMAAALAAGCAGELEDPERFTDCPPGFVEQMFASRCGGACHGGEDPEAGLDLVSADVPARLINGASQTPMCNGRMLIAPEASDPSEHLLVDKLSETPSCGSRMPLNGEPLSSEELECVRRWVDLQLEYAP